jgi:GT2 family glycosyltransferase
MGQVSVIIVSWNARSYLHDCLASVYTTSGALLHEIIVVDNASTDGSPEMVAKMFPSVILIQSKENLGFARANNLGIRRATSQFLALINSDVLVHPGCFQQLTGYFENHHDAGLVGPKILGRDGCLQHSCRRLPTVWNSICRALALDRVLSRWPFFSGFEMWHWNHDTLAEVDVLSGCFWVARRQAVSEVGELDGSFFFYAEDIDWCKRFGDAGWKVVFVPSAVATHFGGGSSSNAPLRYSIELLRANLIYWKKHHGYFGRFTYRLLSTIHYLVRLIARSMAKLTGIKKSADCSQKLKEDIVCLRWLLTGKDI